MKPVKFYAYFIFSLVFLWLSNNCLYADFHRYSLWGYNKITRSLTESQLGLQLFDNPEGIQLVKMPDGTEIAFITDAGWNRILYTQVNVEIEDEWTKAFGNYGQGNGQFHSPLGISADALGDVYIADSYNNRIVHLKYNWSSKNISFIRNMGVNLLSKPKDVYLWDNDTQQTSDDKLYVTDYGNQRIVKLDIDGNVEDVFPDGQPLIIYPCGIVRSGDFVYFVDIGKHRVIVLKDINGFSLEKIVNIEENGGWTGSMLSEIEVDKNGNIFIIDRLACKIIEYTPELNEFISKFGGSGYGPNKFIRLRDISFMKGKPNWMGTVEMWTYHSGLQYYSRRLSILSFTASKESFDASEDTGYADISFKIDDVAEVSIVVLDSVNQTVRTLINTITFPAGTNANVCTWDGKDEEGRLVLPRNFTIKMTAMDGYGNQDVKEILIRIKGIKIDIIRKKIFS